MSEPTKEEFDLALSLIAGENERAAASAVPVDEDHVEVRGIKLVRFARVKFWPDDREWEINRITKSPSGLHFVTVRDHVTAREIDVLASHIHSVTWVPE